MICASAIARAVAASVTRPRMVPVPCADATGDRRRKHEGQRDESTNATHPAEREGEHGGLRDCVGGGRRIAAGAAPMLVVQVTCFKAVTIALLDE